MDDNTIKQHLKLLIENVIFKLMTLDYPITNTETEKWTVNTKAKTLSEYIDSNCKYIMSKLKDKQYRKKILRYHELSEINDDDINEDEMSSLICDITDPIYVVFPSLNSFVHYDFACPIIDELRDELINMIINNK